MEQLLKMMIAAQKLKSSFNIIDAYVMLQFSFGMCDGSKTQDPRNTSWSSIFMLYFDYKSRQTGSYYGILLLLW